MSDCWRFKSGSIEIHTIVSKTMFITSESLITVCLFLCSWNLSGAKSAGWKKNSGGLPTS